MLLRMFEAEKWNTNSEFLTFTVNFECEIFIFRYPEQNFEGPQFDGDARPLQWMKDEGFEYQPTLKAMFKDDSTNVLHGWRKLYKNIEGDSSSPQFPLRLVFGGNNHVVPGTVDINSIPVEDTQPDHHYIIVLKSLNTLVILARMYRRTFNLRKNLLLKLLSLEFL